MDVEVRVLGPVEVDRGDGTVERVHGLAARLLLALIADRGRSVDDDSLVERLWPDAPPRHAMASVRNVVARLRRTFGPAVVGRDLAGYRVDPQAPRLDLDRFRATVAAARLDGTDAARAAEQVDGALQLVRGRPLHEVADDVWAMPAAAAIAEQVAVAEELWASLALVADAADVDVSRLRGAATAHPHREVRWRHLVAALTAAGHRTEALRAAGEARRALAEFGMVPDRGLLDLERQLLGVDAAAAPSSRVMARRDPMVGRDAALADVLRTGHVVWIEGEPGTGKTRLLAEVADRTACDRTALLYVVCPRAPGALGVVPALLAAADDLVPASRRPGLDPGDAHQEPEVRRAALGGDIVARLRAATCEREVVVAVDDVQWADPSDTAVLHDVVVRTLDVVHWIVASRPVTRHAAAATLRGDLERAAAVRAVVLGNLAPADVAELISDVATELDPPARAALAAEVCASTDGHP
ncbi:MAG TPA: BTAD domain-containing putative transcriptional regulator, partial [Ilumatobacteraceae bacterium]|nr:BTAD domain-containing putative transcriptional regulator [Ilumatobacteraceae bacterium]